jgi:membrane associated rhomboid family serine protease/ribosomal protein S27AE
MIGALVIAYIKKLMITYTLIIVNIIIFIITIFFENEIIYGISDYPGLGFRSIYLTLEYSPQLYTLFTSMFIHGGFAHIFGNMFVFFFVGTALEERVGMKKFLIIYLIAGVCGAITQAVLNLNSIIPMIGASGAIFGVMGALAYAFPRDEVVMPIGIGIMFLTKIKVIYAVLFFAAIETIVVWLDVQDTTAHFAHLGGLLGGFILAAILIKKVKKNRSGSFQTIHYDSNLSPKSSEINISNLKQLANTSELKEILKKIENETVQQVKDVWLEHFFEKAVCPKCKNNLNNFDNRVWCEKCGFRTNY